MTDKPIIFSAPMIRALLDGRKTQTRRIIKVNGMFPDFCGGRGDRDDPTCWGWEDHDHGDWVTLEKEPGQRMGWRDWRGAYRSGDRLWVREVHAFGWPVAPGDRFPRNEGPDHAVTYRADGMEPFGGSRWRSPIHMPRWASRLTLTVTDVRVQRVQEITGRDVIAEGVRCEGCHDVGTGDYSACRDGGCFAVRNDFRDLWNSIHGPDAWDANPWVCALTFDVHC